MSTNLSLYVELTALDSVSAEFSSDLAKAKFEMPVSEWITLGRPGKIRIEVGPDAE